MGEGSDEATIEEELAALKEEVAGDSTDADLAALEAELDAEDDARVGSDGTSGGAGSVGGTGGPAGDVGDDLDGVGLDRDPSEQYAHLLDDPPASGTGRAGGGDRSADGESGGGLLGRLLGRGGGDAAARREEGDAGAAGVADVPGVDDLLGPEADRVERPEPDGTETGRRGGVRARLGRYFSPRWFLGALVTMLLLGGIGSTFVPIVGGPLGLGAGALVVGLASSRRTYLEVAVAGAVLGALASVADAVTIAYATGTLARVAGVGAGAGLVASLVGVYVGRDLRGALLGGSSEWEEELP